MNKTFKDYIAQSLKGHNLRFKCDCIVPLDVIGTIKDYEIVSGEIIFIVDVKGKIIKIGENHPNLYVEVL